jgi:hypothetical protein
MSSLKIIIFAKRNWHGYGVRQNVRYGNEADRVAGKSTFMKKRDEGYF